VQPHLYDAQIPPVVYLSGVLMFIGGLAIVRAHSVWARNRTVLVTLSGWSFLLLGLVRMFAASQYRQATQSISPGTFMVLEGDSYCRTRRRFDYASCPASLRATPPNGCNLILAMV
jgi:hypothetical protein